jgi:hypothetical protein
VRRNPNQLLEAWSCSNAPGGSAVALATNKNAELATAPGSIAGCPSARGSMLNTPLLMKALRPE